nr:LacI family DNA-binding transcriptional regulator [Arcanobacterium phocae]
MADVAKLAKVSSQTVSRVLSGKGTVRPETERRVRNAIEYLGYQPSIAAQMLASGTSKAIGVLTIGNLSYGRMQAFSAFERVARANGHYVMPATSTSYEIDDLIEAIHYFRQARIRSLVIIGQRVELIKELIPHIKVPTVVAINTDLEFDHVSVVQIDQVTSTQKLLSHMIDVGAKNIVFLGPEIPDVDAVLRQQAYVDFCERNDIEPIVIQTPGWGAADGAKAGQQILQTCRFDGIIAANDHLAIGCSAALKEHSRLTPGTDYALAGFDDIETAAFQYPGLTTVRQGFIDYADVVFQQVEEMHSTGEAQTRKLFAEVIVRGSTSWFNQAK